MEKSRWLQTEDVYLEAELENITSLPMLMERVSLEPAEHYNSQPISSYTNAKGEERSVFEGSEYLAPGDTRQYLYRLSPKPAIPPKAFRGVSSIGKVDMVWRTGLGERGRLQTPPLQRVAPGTGDVGLSVTACPGRASVGEEIELICSLLNASERSLELSIHFEVALSGELEWLSEGGGRSLGLLPPATNKELPLKLRAKAPGLHWISGLRLTDLLLSRTYELDEIAQIFVQS